MQPLIDNTPAKKSFISRLFDSFGSTNANMKGLDKVYRL